MDFYDVEVECMSHCYGGSPKFSVEPYGYGEWAKREDVDALLAERDALRAELASVKAESLRVVVDGAKCQPHEIYPTQFILYDSRVWVNAPGTRDIVDITNNNRVSVPYDTIVQPVHLERWEDEE